VNTQLPLALIAAGLAALVYLGIALVVV
jgi:hypothetical protein